MSNIIHPQPLCVLYRLIGANMNVTTDQQFKKMFDFTNYLILQARICNASVSLTTAVGGVYTAPAKAGIAAFAASLAYSGLTGPTIGQAVAAANVGLDELVAADLYLSLTTPQGAPATMDFYIFGIPLS